MNKRTNTPKATTDMLMPHNHSVYQEVEETLLAKQIAVLETATGTGKSYIAGQLIKNHNWNTLVLVPKIVLSRAWENLTERYHLSISVMTYHLFSAPSTDIEAILNSFDMVICDAYEIIGLNQKSLINQGLDWLRPIFLTQKEATKMSIRRFYEQRRKSAA